MKTAIYVFTDADCGYCRKFHSEIDEVNALGIEVRYLPWPRSEQTMPIMEKSGVAVTAKSLNRCQIGHAYQCTDLQ